MEEIWKDIKDYECLYQVSDIGNVKSLKRKGRTSDHILRPGVAGRGYLFVRLSKNKNQKSWYIHILVAMAFNNHIPDGRKTIIDHKDNNKLNNNKNNLAITTQRINTSKDRFRKSYTSKYVGVYWKKDCKKWHASIWIINKRINLGHFDNELDAAKAYQNKLKSL